MSKSGNMYDALDNRVVYLPCILHFMQTKPYIVLSRDASCTLRSLNPFLTDMYVRIDVLHLFFNAPVTVVADGFAWKQQNDRKPYAPAGL